MNNSNKHNNTIEEALAMYKETVSPSSGMLINVLNQIPEIKEIKTSGRAIRSPYIWRTVAQVMSVFVVAVALVYPGSPLVTSTSSQESDPFYAIDKQVDDFETKIHNEDYQNTLKDYTTLSQ